MLLEELDDYLTAEVPALAGFISLTGLPNDPTRAVALIEQPGTPPIRLMGDRPTVAENIRVQVRNRNKEYPDARADAFLVYRALESVTDRALGGGHFYRVAAVQAPFPTGRDDRDRWLFSCNYDVWRADAA